MSRIVTSSAFAQAPLEHGGAAWLLSDEMVADMVQDSYDLVVGGLARTRRRALRWAPDGDR